MADLPQPGTGGVILGFGEQWRSKHCQAVHFCEHVTIALPAPSRGLICKFDFVDEAIVIISGAAHGFP